MQGVNIPYVNLSHTLKCIKIQIIDSINFADSFIPTYIKTPEQLFYFLKGVTKFQADPKGIELIREFKTLINNNGGGDCDDLVVASISSLYVLNFNPLYVTITGNNEFSATHVYCELYDPYKKKITAFDLTNKKYDQERKYKYKQRLKINL